MARAGRRSRGWTSTRLVLALLACPGVVGTRPGAAAVRFCADRVEAAADDTTSEVAARRLALERWRQGARALGESFTRWELANNRSVVCARIPGGFRCRAGAAPCSISQNPGRLPEALKPPPSPAAPPFPPPKRRLDI